MKSITYFVLVLSICACQSGVPESSIDESKHEGLVELASDYPFKVLYSEGHEEEAAKHGKLLNEANQFLLPIIGPKSDFCLLVIAAEDWERNAYSPVPGMPEYYKGNLIVGAGVNGLATNYEGFVESLPRAITDTLYQVYTNAAGKLDLKLFFDKLSVHELTHNFQDPNNGDHFSVSRWLEEIHANMGQYAFYKFERPEELHFITTFVEFNLQNPPPELKFTTLEAFDANYYEMDPANYGFYQMQFTKVAQLIIDAKGKEILKPLNDFLIKYDDSWKGKINQEELLQKLNEEVDPDFVDLINEVL